MALLHMDGFDRYADITDCGQYGSYAAAASPAWILQPAGGAWGGGALVPPNSGGRYIRRLIPGNPAELWTCFWIKFVAPVNAIYALASFESAGGTLENLITLNTETKELRGYRNTVQLGSANSSVDLPQGAWHWVELRSVLHDSAGVLEAWINGIRVLNLTGVDTKASTATAYASVCLGASAVSAGPGSSNFFYDDWIILDTTGAANNTRPGKRRITTLYPTGDAGPNDGVPSTGSAHSGVVDEPRVDVSDTLALTNTAGQGELFALSDLQATPLGIDCVKVSAVVGTDDGGAASGRVFVNSGGVVADGPVAAVTQGYTTIDQLLASDPATTTAWTRAGVDGLKAGYKVA